MTSLCISLIIIYTAEPFQNKADLNNKSVFYCNLCTICIRWNFFLRELGIKSFTAVSHTLGFKLTRHASQTHSRATLYYFK